MCYEIRELAARRKVKEVHSKDKVLGLRERGLAFRLQGVACVAYGRLRKIWRLAQRKQNAQAV